MSPLVLYGTLLKQETVAHHTGLSIAIYSEADSGSEGHGIYTMGKGKNSSGSLGSIHFQVFVSITVFIPTLFIFIYSFLSPWRVL